MLRSDSNTATVIGIRNMKIYTKFGCNMVSSVIDGVGVGIVVVVGTTVISCAADVVVVVDAGVVEAGAGVLEVGAGDVVLEVGAGDGVLEVGAGDVVLVVGAGDVVLVFGSRVQFSLPSGAKPALHTQEVALGAVC